MTIKILHKETGEVIHIVAGDTLVEAELKRTSLRYANLSNSDLERISLCHCDLRDADLSGANLRDADLRYADLTGATLDGADLTGAELYLTILPKHWKDTKGLVSPEEGAATLEKIRATVLEQPQRLAMNSWHGNDSDNWRSRKTPEQEIKCGTTHCLAGWAQALSTDKKMRLEEAEVAGGLLIPQARMMFYESGDVARAWLEERGWLTQDA